MEEGKGFKFYEMLQRIKKAAVRLHIMSESMDGVPRPGIMALRRIKKAQSLGEKIKISDLSMFMNVSKPAITFMITDLEKRGLVERIYDKQDRRRIFLSLTEKGEEFVEKSEEEANNFFAQVFEKLGEHDSDELIRIFEKLGDILENICDEKKSEQNSRKDDN